MLYTQIPNTQSIKTCKFLLFNARVHLKQISFGKIFDCGKNVDCRNCLLDAGSCGWCSKSQSLVDRHLPHQHRIPKSLSTSTASFLFPPVSLSLALLSLRLLTRLPSHFPFSLSLVTYSHNFPHSLTQTPTPLSLPHFNSFTPIPLSFKLCAT